MNCPNLAVPTEVMRHVVNVESGANPFAIGVVGGRLARQPKNLDEAVATANMLETKGYNYSLGLAQVNRVNFDKYGFDTPAKAFDVCANLSAGANILADCYRDAHGNWGKAFSCYYSGNFITGFLQGYVQKIYDSILGGAQAPDSPIRALAIPFMSDSNAAAYAVAASAAGTSSQAFPKKQITTTVRPPATVPHNGPPLTTAAAQRIVMRSVPATDPANVDARPTPVMPLAAAARVQTTEAAAHTPAPVAVRAPPASGIFEPQVSGPNDPPPTATNGPVATPPVERDSAFVF